MGSYQVEKRTAMAIALADRDGKLSAVPTGSGGARLDREIERLSMIMQSFNDEFGNIEWDDADRVLKRITKEIQSSTRPWVGCFCR